MREQGPHPQEVRRLRNGKASDGETQDGEEEAGDLDEEGVSSRGGDRRGKAEGCARRWKALESKHTSPPLKCQVHGVCGQDSAFFTVQLSHPYMTTGKTIALTRWTFAGQVMSLLFNVLSRF